MPVVTYRVSVVTYMIPIVVTYNGGIFMMITAAEREYLTEIEIRKYTQKTIRSYKNNLDLFIR